MQASPDLDDIVDQLLKAVFQQAQSQKVLLILDNVEDLLEQPGQGNVSVSAKLTKPVLCMMCPAQPSHPVPLIEACFPPFLCSSLFTCFAVVAVSPDMLCSCSSNFTYQQTQVCNWADGHVIIVLLLQALEMALTAMTAALPNLLLVLTSRRQIAFVDLAYEQLEVGPLASEDAEQLLRKSAPDMSEVYAAELARKCGNIPYPLRLLGCTIQCGDATPQVSQKARLHIPAANAHLGVKALPPGDMTIRWCYRTQHSLTCTCL